jgi:predicted nucleic acid-binding protein
MRVYVETNFVLELALQQEQHAACEAILEMAEARQVELVLPAYSLVEASTALRRRTIERKGSLDDVNRQLREVARMKGYAPSVEQTTKDMQALLVDAVQKAGARFAQLTRRLHAGSILLPLAARELAKASELETEYGLSYPDVLVLAPVLCDPDIGRAESCFLNRNTKDFDDSVIRGWLKQRRCTLLGGFESGLQYIRARGSQPS